jgi:leader peptidase (prepilin peptidase)/N-methyltransferase
MCELAEWICFILLAIAAVIDWKKQEVPIWLLVFMSTTTIVFIIFCNDVNGWHRLAGAMLGSFFFVISKFTKEAVGYGDSWLMLILGVHFGFFRALQLLFIASVLAALFAIVCLWKCKWKRSATLPFVPFLAIAYIGVMYG